MRADDTNELIQMLDLLLEFLADGAHWTRGHYHDVDGRCCLIGALVLRRKHHASSDAAVYFLQEAMPLGVLGLSTSMIAAPAVSPTCARSLSRTAPSRLAREKANGPLRQ